MQYFAIGENNGGAGEKRLGPFDTIEEAQAAGEMETSESNGGFVFRGVVDEANNQVFTASDKTALNAKFKVGDVVIARGIKGKIVRVTDKGTYIQEGEDGNNHELKEESIMKISNSRVRNAYCEAGDYIETRDGGQERVERVVGDKVYLKSGDVISMSDVKSILNRRVRTSCPVVANAIAANRRVARNSVEVEVSLRYAGRVQHAMRDAARSISGVRMSSTNTLVCSDEDAADDVVDMLEQAGVPKSEISLNAKKRVARNAEGFDKSFVEQKARSIYNDLDDLLDYLKRFSSSGIPVYMMASVTNAMKALRNI